MYISYINLDGFPVTKAILTPRKMEGLKYIYFTTNTSSNKIKAYLKNNKGSVYFVDKRFHRDVSLIESVEVLTDEENKKMIWKEGDTRYYSQGVNDPDYCVIKFTKTHGKYYASHKNQNFLID